MRKPIASYLISMALIFFSNMMVSNPVHAADEYENGTLRGLEAVSVVVENLSSDIQHDGLTREVLVTDSELRLRKAGIRVITPKEQKSPGSPYLYVNVVAQKSPSVPLYAYSISVSLRQSVLLERDTTIGAHASTWQTSGVGVAGTSKIQSIRERLADLLDEFINDYLAVNHK